MKERDTDWDDEGRREEGHEGPNIKHLGEVDGGDVICLIPCWSQ